MYQLIGLLHRERLSMPSSARPGYHHVLEHNVPEGEHLPIRQLEAGVDGFGCKFSFGEHRPERWRDDMEVDPGLGSSTHVNRVCEDRSIT